MIVGAGPAGLTLSALLSQYGVPSVVVEKAMALPTHPQAHFINLRTMEILRHAFGKLDETVLDGCPPREEWRLVSALVLVTTRLSVAVAVLVTHFMGSRCSAVTDVNNR